MILGRRLSTFLDSVRWVSALLVVLFHVRGAIVLHWADVTSRSPLLVAIYLVSTVGHEAVMVFFVLSGFLVGGTVLAGKRSNSFDLRRYVVNRVSRLYAVLPAALLVGGLIDAAGVRWLHYAPIPAMGTTPAHTIQDHLSLGIGVANLLNLQTIVAPPLGTNGVLWSLANEFWYYVLFPLLVLSLDANRRLRIRLLSGVAFLVVFGLLTPAIRLYSLVWLLGVAVWLLKKPLMRSASLALLLLVGSFAVAVAMVRVAAISKLLPTGYAMSFPGDFLVALAFANLLLTVKCQPDPEPARREAGGFNSAMAEFSYSLYLVHAPFLYFAAALYQKLVPPSWVRVLPTGSGALVVLAFLATIYGYSYLFSLLTERHSGRLRGWLAQRFRVRGAARSPAPER